MPTIKRNSDRPPWVQPRQKPYAGSRQDVYRTHRWKELSARYKAHNPICAACGVEATMYTDHITPLSQGGEPYALSNLQPLCHGCHQAKTQREAQTARKVKAGGGSNL